MLPEQSVISNKLKLSALDKNLPVLRFIRSRLKRNISFKGLTFTMEAKINLQFLILSTSLLEAGARVILIYDPKIDRESFSLLNKFETVEFVSQEDSVKLKKIKSDFIIDNQNCDLTSLIIQNKLDNFFVIKGIFLFEPVNKHYLNELAKTRKFRTPFIDFSHNPLNELLYVQEKAKATVMGIAKATDEVFSGQNVLIIGYSSLGREIALSFRNLGAVVTVFSTDSFHNLQAHLDGYRLMSIEQAIQQADLVVVVEGKLESKHIEKAKNNLKIAYATDNKDNINSDTLKLVASDGLTTNPLLYTYQLGKKTCHLIAGGRAVSRHMTLTLSLDLFMASQLNFMDSFVKNQSLSLDEIVKSVIYEIAKIKLESEEIKTLK